MRKFQHKHAADCRVEYEIAPGGGLKSCRMIVESAISLDPQEDDYENAAATDLEVSAVSYARERGIGTLIFTRRYFVDASRT